MGDNVVHTGFRAFLLAVVQQGFFLAAAAAQHPIDIEKQAAEGRYFEALLNYDRLPARRATLSAIIAAGRSAWALGLPERAAREFDKALRDESLGVEGRARVLLSRAIAEFQEGRYQLAALFAEKGARLLEEPGPLRAQHYLVWGEALSKMGSLGLAEEKYRNALNEAGAAERPSIHFMLGVCQLRLGDYEQAKFNFEAIPLRHEESPAAMRYLAQIAMQQQDYERAIFWLERGRDEFPESFLDSWVDYAMLTAATIRGDKTKVKDIQEGALKRYPPSDPWVIMLDAAAEAFWWQQSLVRAVSKEGI